MAFELHQRKHIEDELAKIVRRELGQTVLALAASAGSTFESAVHESRKSIKHVRAAAAFLEQAGAKPSRKDRKRLKAAARALSRLRDSAAIIETFDRLRRRYPTQLSEHTYSILRRGLVGARNGEHERAQREGVVDEVVVRLSTIRESAKKWASASIDVSSIGALVAVSYHRSRAALKRAHATEQSATLHRWRKELKTLWYQLRLVKPLTTGVAPLIADLERLETALGDDHNLVVLAATLRGCRDLPTMRADIREIGRLAVRMRQPLRRRAFTLGRRVYVRTPKAFAGWIRGSVKQPRLAQAAAS